MPKCAGVRAKEGQRSLNVRSVEKDIMDNVGHKATHHHIKIHRKEDGKVVAKEMAKEHRRVASPKEKVEPKGKAKVKERKDNVSTKLQNLHRNSGLVDHGNSGQTNPGKLTKMIGTQQSRVLKNQQQLKNFNMLPPVNCDFRILVLPITSNLSSLTDVTLPS